MILHHYAGKTLSADDPLRYAVEVSPWTPVEDLRTATLWRGVIVGAWGSVETALKEIALRASRCESFAPLDARIPNSRGDLIEYLRLVLTDPGPLSAVASELKILVDGYEASAEHRNLLAHAHMSVLPNWPVIFKTFQAKRDKLNGDHFSYSEIKLTIEQLDGIALLATQLSRAAQILRDHIDEHGYLPKFDQCA